MIKQRFLLVSDIHYTVEPSCELLKKHCPEVSPDEIQGNSFGITQRQKAERVYLDIMEAHRRHPLDAVFILGDLSSDDYGIKELSVSYCKNFKEEFLDRLPVPSYAIPGNHDSWPNDLWREMMGTDRQIALELGDCAFILADTFPHTPATKGANPAVPPDGEFLRANLEKYKGKRIFICAHYLDRALFTEMTKRLICESGDVVFMYRGHTHANSVIDMGEEYGNVKLFDIGGYASGGRVLDGIDDPNFFKLETAWGYQILEIHDDHIKTYHIKPAMRYLATNGVFNVEETVLDDVEYKL